MDKDRFTCTQKTCFIFEFFPKQVQFHRKKAPLNSSRSPQRTDSQSIRQLKRLLAERLERIACMIDLLQQTHENWMVTRKKDRVFMETKTYDFNDAVDRLANEGFRSDEYLLEVDYERKWGML
ncbi:hypothetical protein QS257_12665 [Terrilactibacillus sp. S3-3]|nr:hypothetical protein QS257_12665 [Terrilactibacillus sp. S3-3]